jgi:hypothetical protein
MSNPEGYRLFHPVYEPYRNCGLRLSAYDWVAEGSRFRTISRSLKEFVKRCLPAPSSR